MTLDFSKLKAAAEAGDAQAQYGLGFQYYADPALADYGICRAWMEKAALQDFAPAIFMLGFMYEHALGVKSDVGVAFKLYERAAHLGNHQAQCNLAALYEEGLGCHKDMGKAREWYQKAERSGSQTAKANLSRLTQMYGR